MIGKELLGEVLNIEIIEILGDGQLTQDNNLLANANTDKGYIDINIHELAHKCKEWAYKQKFCVASLYDFQESNMWVAMVTTIKSVDIDEIFHCKTEHESIFKACQWILDNKGN